MNTLDIFRVFLTAADTSLPAGECEGKDETRMPPKNRNKVRTQVKTLIKKYGSNPGRQVYLCRFLPFNLSEVVSPNLMNSSSSSSSLARVM